MGKYRDKFWLSEQYIIQNKTMEEISKEFNCGINTISRYLKRYNIKKVHKYRDKDWLYDQYIIQNKTMEKIAKEINVDRQTILKFIKKFNIKKIKKHLNKKWLLDQYIAQNKTMEEISKMLDITRSAVNLQIIKFGIKKNIESINKTRLPLYKKTLLKNYGVDVPLKSSEIRKNFEKTMMRNHGVINAVYSEKCMEKRKITNKYKYGTEHSIRSKIVQKKIKQNQKETSKKIYETKKKNGTFNTSKPEQEILEFLKKNFPDTTYQYKSEEYPFSCDYYIPSLDLYIEFQGSWTHGKKPFNGSNLNPKWLKGASEGSKFYKTAISVYTEKDPLKRKTASENNLNYLEIWYSDYKKGLEHILKLVNL